MDDQVGPLNEGFTPTETEVEGARAILQAYADATESGTLATISIDGRIITADLARQRSNVVALSRAIRTREMFKAAAIEGRPVPVP